MPRYTDELIATLKQSVDIVELIGDSLTLHPHGSQYRALCPFHDDHNPSLIINPGRQSYKCWSCGAGGDLLEFVQQYERVEFPEAVRLLADRAGVALEADVRGSSESSWSKSDLFRLLGQVAEAYSDQLWNSSSGQEARNYVEQRHFEREICQSFGLGYAPEDPQWLLDRAKVNQWSQQALVHVGLLIEPPVDSDRSQYRPRFRGRLIFPIRDLQGRVLGFGGRILPSVQRQAEERGIRLAKYLNSPESSLFQKRFLLYGVDLARQAARRTGRTVIVEGYTDVIAAHQAGLSEAVATLGTAFGEDHVRMLKRMADRTILVFDGDQAGQEASDRALETFLKHKMDVRILGLPVGIDPCDELLERGLDAFQARLEAAEDPIDHLLSRAEARFDLDDLEASRRALDWVIGILSQLQPRTGSVGEFKVARGLERLAHRLGVSKEVVHRNWREHWQSQRRRHSLSELVGSEAVTRREGQGKSPHRYDPDINSLDPVDREWLGILLHAPELVPEVITRIPVNTMRTPSAQALLKAIYTRAGLAGGDEVSSGAGSELDQGLRQLETSLENWQIDQAPIPARIQPAPWQERLEGVLDQLNRRLWNDRLHDLNSALAEVDPQGDSATHQALRAERLRLLARRPGLGHASAS